MANQHYLRLVCLSDTHGLHDQVAVPDGDVLLHAGDVSRRGELLEVIEFNRWLGTLPHRHKVVIAGNHDFLFEQEPGLAASLITHATYLNDTEIQIEGVRIWGSPISPWYHDWAFNRQPGAEIQRHWDLVPPGTDILITHGPPHGVLDLTRTGQMVGCPSLRQMVAKIGPRLHLFGHIRFVNACLLNARYEPVNAPVVIDWPLA
jgi:predicted phosphohydrolase